MRIEPCLQGRTPRTSSRSVTCPGEVGLAVVDGWARFAVTMKERSLPSKGRVTSGPRRAYAVRRGASMGEVLRVILRWTAAWTLLGVIGGVAMMFGKVPPIAESGAKPSDPWFYAFWIPVLGVAAGVFGFALGVLFSVLMALLKNWRSRAEARDDVVGQYGPRILCGTLAGGMRVLIV